MSTGPVTWLGLGLGLGLGCEGEGTRQDSFGMLFTKASRARLLAPLRVAFLNIFRKQIPLLYNEQLTTVCL